MVFPMFQVLGKSDNSNRFWTPCCVLLRNFLHFLPSFCLHISETMESDIFSFMWKTDKTVRFVRNQQLGSQIILHAKGLSINYICHLSREVRQQYTPARTHSISELNVTNIYVFGGSSRVSLMTWICLHFCFQLECYQINES